ncbi:MAG: class I SAM-dependent methyltransferase [Microlunatus sp.]|nr:class I SAM-dependent methyltransferase [Microlunatus sp.]
MTRYEDAQAIFEVDPAAATADDPVVVGEAFDRIEEDFGRFLDESLHPRGRESLDDLLARANPPRGGTAVDVGCGRGRDVVALARRFGLHVHGVDPSPANVEQARQRVAAEGLHDQADLQIGRAEQIPLADASVDVLWCKEVITFTDPDTAMREFLRVLRPGGVGVVYQVLAGPAMSASEADWLTAQEMGFGPARILRPDDVEQAIRSCGLELSERIDYAGEWGELGEESDGSAGRRLLHAARLIRAPQLYIDRYGTSNYRIMLADCLWHVYRMIGKLWGVAFLIKRQ